MLPRMTSFRILAALACMLALAALLILVVLGGMHGSVVVALKEMAADPWGLATLVDLLIGLVLVSAWIFVLEPRRGAWLAWTISLFLLGNISTVIFFAVRIRHSESLRTWLLEPRQRHG